ncbi:MAG TPA: Tad domain-containing protein [Armatimonadota bacterium]|jgi:hypothetical protein
MATLATRRGPIRAAILIQVAMLMVVMLGFAALTTDYGLLLIRQRALQNGVDSAALAAGPELGDPNTGAVSMQHVYDYAAANRIPVSSVVINNGPRDLPRTLKVTSTDTVATVFARVLNPRNRSGQVSASAWVAAYPVTKAWRLRPWGVNYAFFNPENTGAVHFNEPATLALTQNTDEVPNGLGDNQTFINPLDLGAADATGSYTNYIRNCSQGYDQPMAVGGRGNVVIGHPGSLEDITFATAQGVKSGAQSILTQAGASAYQRDTWDNPGDSPRLVILPVINRLVASGGANSVKFARIEGFAAFYIEDMSGNEIRGRFVHYSLKYNNQDPNVVDPDSYNYGLYTFHLIDPNTK